jgi:hypothetical protein
VGFRIVTTYDPYAKSDPVTIHFCCMHGNEESETLSYSASVGE